MVFSIVCFEQIGESFLRNNIAFIIHSVLVCARCAIAVSQLLPLVHVAARTWTAWVPNCLPVPGGGAFLQKVCKESIVQQFRDPGEEKTL